MALCTTENQKNVCDFSTLSVYITKHDTNIQEFYMLKKLLIASLIAGTAVAFTSQAEDRALLIGVGEYKYPEITNLPGIELDINMMKEAVDLMGYKSVKILLNDQATLKNITQAMQGYLVNGVSSHDRVLIYFSGHGTNIPDESGDEPDGVDEVLTTYNTKPTTIAGKPSLAGVLVDDELSRILKKIPSHNTLVLLDACNSGTATKGLRIRGGLSGKNLVIRSKAFKYKGMPMSMASKGNFMVQKKKQAGNYVAISAAGDTESAQATSNGSLFTQGVLGAVKKAAKNKSVLTPKKLMDETTAFIVQENQQEPFTPQLSGNDQLAQKAIKIINVRTAENSSNSNNHGQTWKKLSAIADKSAPLDISINQKKYYKGDFLVITIKNNQSGYLNVINVGPKDQPTILFPNKHHDEAKVQGSIAIPTAQMDFDLAVQEPYGESLIVAFFTEKPLNLYKKEGKKGIDIIFKLLSSTGLKTLTRSFGVEKKASGKVKAGKIVTLVCESESKCN